MLIVLKREPYGTNKSIKYFIGLDHISLDHYVQNILKWSDMLNALIVMRQKVTDKKFLKIDTEIWKKFSNLMNITFDSEHVCAANDKYIKKKIKI